MYQPITIDYNTGIINLEYGIGVITPQGAYVTGKLPPFSRIYMPVYIPTMTEFRKKDGSVEILRVTPQQAIGVKQLTAIIPKPLPHPETVTVKLTEAKPLPGKVILTEEATGKFSAMIFTTRGEKVLQPANGWTTEGFRI